MPKKKRHLSAAHRRKLAKTLAKARIIRWAKIKGEAATDSKTAKKKDRRCSAAGDSGKEAEVRETGCGLVEHLDEIGRQQGPARLLQYLMKFRIHYREDSRGRGESHGLRVKIRDPFHPDTMPEWLKLARIYSNGNGNPGHLQKTFEEHNVSGHLRALLRVAQVARGSADGSEASRGEPASHAGGSNQGV